jgi:uncharacterized membrane protein YhaH (DUF805 family)
MDMFKTIFSASGRLAPRPFMLGALGVYGGGFLSEGLLWPPYVQWGHLVPFTLVQIALAWVWYALHAKRLRDAGRSVGAAVVLILLYVLVVGSVLAMILIASKVKPLSDTGGFLVLGLLPYLPIALFTAALFGVSAMFELFNPALFSEMVAMSLTTIVCVGFTIWLGTRPRVPPPVPAPP